MQIHSPTKAEMTTSGQQRVMLLEPSLESMNIFIQPTIELKNGKLKLSNLHLGLV